MEDNTGIKAAPVTRLRRRLSVEQPEESKSPAANTPSKRRGGRRPVKPELELIDENTPVNTPQDKNTKKGVSKDVEISEEKPITPSRRSTRIRSNTSIVSESASIVDSPRAKRAARRLSQVGSDTESSTTPVRQTRRIRKESVSSIDKDNQSTTKPSNHTTEPITEENESNNKELITVADKEDVSKVSRKSPRLLEKNTRKSISLSPQAEKESNDSKNNDENDKSEVTIKESSVLLIPVQVSPKNSPKKTIKINKERKISPDSALLLESMDIQPKEKISDLNKSTSALELKSCKNMRSRTKSCNYVSNLSTHDTVFYSDNEKSINRKKQNNIMSLKSLKESGSGNDLSNISKQKTQSKNIPMTENENEINEKYETSKSIESPVNTSTKCEISFDKGPSENLKTTIFIEDSEKIVLSTNNNEDDQCVPEVGQIGQSVTNKQNAFNTSKENFYLNKSKEKSVANNSCEPMDIDETIPENLLVQNIDKQENTSEGSLHLSVSEKSKRKSSIQQSIDNSGIQNKSTLILTDLKDVSNNETNDIAESPLKSRNNRLSNAPNDINITQENINCNKNLCYSTSTPLQQKLHSKEIHVGTSKEKVNKKKRILPKSKLGESQSDSDTSEFDNRDNIKNNTNESEDDSSHGENLLDNEAEDAEDYESGDSQNEDEKEYARDNEIIEKGETLSTEEDISNDSDYEKDSFVVSSAEEDNDLLEGTEDDLSMSDNELKMTAKSKQKYNERKKREQKEASREMFESRHKLNISNNSRNKSVKDDNSSSESDYDIKKSRINRKQRLDSDHNISSTEDNNIKSIQKHSKARSKSISNDNKTTANEVTVDPSPLSNKKKSPEQDNNSMAFMDAGHNEQDEGNNLDPLATTITHEDESSLSSENENIVQDYDALLNNLNKSNVKIKTRDNSLNTEKKIKNESHCIDEPDLTQTKAKKTKPTNATIENLSKTQQDNEDTSSSSTDSDYLKLLFSEDSYEDINKAKDNDDDDDDDDDNYISLKKTRSQSDILLNADTDNSALNQSGSRTPLTDKKKRESLSGSNSNVDVQININDLPINKSDVKTPQSKRKERKNVNEHSDEEKEGKDLNNLSLNQPEIKTPLSGKKKRKSLSETDTNTDVEKYDDTSINKSAKKTPQKGKKMLKTGRDSDAVEEINLNNLLDQSEGKIPLSGKKKKRKSLSETETNTDMEINLDNFFNQPDSKTPLNGKKKKRKSLSETDTNTDIGKDDDTSINKSSNRTPQIGKNVLETEQDSDFESNEEINLKNLFNQTKNKSPLSGKKKKRKSLSETDTNTDMEINHNLSLNQPEIKIPLSGKKKRKSLSETDTNTDMDTNNISINKAVKAPQSSKQGLKTTAEEHSEPVEEIDISAKLERPQKQLSSSKKKQRKLSETSISQNDANVNIKKGQNERRKRKISSTPSEEGRNHTSAEAENVQIIKKKKKVKLSQEQNESLEQSKKSKCNKRKEREDDDISQLSKTLKENLPKKIEVPRLPPSVLEQLNEVPTRESDRKRSKVISTTNFIVEKSKIRKNKPSQYLEDSIYLNEDEKDSRKRKMKTDRPKVLPFVPTVSTSSSGYTSNFKVNVLSQDIKFIAQSSNSTNFKNDYLYNKKIKRIGTYETYKKNRIIKLSKF